MWLFARQKILFDSLNQMDENLKKYAVEIYYSGFCTYEIKAVSEEEAIEKARKMPLNEDEILTNLENWFEADDVEEI